MIKKSVYLILPLYLISSQISYASFTLTPMVQSIELGEKHSVKSFSVENKGKENLLLDASIEDRFIDSKGRESSIKNLDMDKFFTIYPRQLMLKPKEVRIIRVNWIGPKVLDQERAFRLSLIELHGKERATAKTKFKTSIVVVLRYLASLFVIPKDAKDITSVKSFNLKKEKSNYFVNVILQNTGNMHRVIINFNLNLKYLNSKGEEKVKVFGDSDIEEGHFSGHSILANHTRDINLNLKGEDITSIVSVNLTFK